MQLRFKTKGSAALAAGMMLALGAGIASAADEGTVTVEVNNAIPLTEDTPLNFGTVFAVNHSASTAFIAIAAADGAVTSGGGGAQITPLSGATRGVFTVGPLAAFQSVTVTPDAGTATLTHSSGNPGVATFQAASFEVDNANPTADASGNITVNVGARLRNVVSGNTFQDGTYSGTYDLTVSY